jgi:N-acetylglucosaminyldiphosphoundecaprenol N-acetyl-beta-D-mannosaminyltransferase
MERDLGVEIVGVDAPLISTEGGEGEAAVLAHLRRARPDLVLVGLGSPKQERFIHRSMAGIAPVVAVGVGASIDFLAGRVRRAPPWISRAGLEWLFRLSLEPRRLAYRYLVKDPRFLAVLARTAREPRSERTRILPEDHGFQVGAPRSTDR